MPTTEKARKKNRKKTTPDLPEEVPRSEAPIEEAVAESVPDESSNIESSATSSRRALPTYESVQEDWERMLKMIDAEIEELRATPGKHTGVRFLRRMKKELKLLMKRSLRLAKKKRKNTGASKKNSQFVKPQPISKEFAKFAGWDPSEEKSRNDVFKFCCKYVKEHKLENPEDRRQLLIQNDKKFAKLLRYDPTSSKPYLYCSIQKSINHHFPRLSEKSKK